MPKNGLKRKLAAILSADVEGYSRLMGNDEASTIDTLTAYKEAMTAHIKQNRGRVVDAPGDNLLAEFASVVDAVQCAVEIQRELAERNEELTKERKMAFRIGVNLGDIVEEKDRIYGDGVNIAARLESICEGGGICISGTAFEHVENKLDLEFEDLGDHEVKNIEKPVQVYRVLPYPGAAAHGVIRAKKAFAKKWRKMLVAVVAVLIVVGAVAVWRYYFRSPTIEAASIEKMAYPLPDKPSIAVLPFENISSDPEQDLIVDGITDSIITGLSQVPDLFVVAQNSTLSYKGKPVKIRQVSEELGVRYVLGGSVQKAGDRLRINAHLIDATKGNHLWAKGYDRELKDLFALQDEITKKVITELKVKLTEGEAERIWAKCTDNLESYLKQLQSEQHFRRKNKDDNFLAQQMAEEAIALDPENACAYYLLGHTHLNDVLFRSTNSPRKSMDRAFELAKKALSINESLFSARNLFGSIYIIKGQHEKAIAEVERAIALAPNSAQSHAVYGWALYNLGRYEESIAILKKAIRLNPIPDSIVFYFLGTAYFLNGQHKEAITALKKAIHLQPKNLFAHIMLAATYASSGHKDEAYAEAAEVLKINPGFSLDYWAKMPTFKNQDDKDRVVEGLRRAGLK
jgi:adenylate cyclase